MAPCGPYILPKQFLENVNNLHIKLAGNGEVMMNANTSEMLYKVPEKLSILSEFHTLQPGDIVFTGSSSGSAGHHGGRWLKPGDTIRAQIGPIGPFEVTMREDTSSKDDARKDEEEIR